MILAIIQARMSSRRLPGKVLMPLQGKPMLYRQWQRVSQSKLINKVVVATSDEPSDAPIREFCRQYDMEVFAGSLNNVLQRFYKCASPYLPNHVIRLTADCPLSDPDVIDQVVRVHIADNNDYTSNAYPHTFPDGLDVEVMRFDTLEQTYRQATSNFHKEHVTPFIREHEQQFKVGSVHAPEDYSQQRWTVDYPEDMLLVKEIFAALHKEDRIFGWQQVLAFISKRPDLFALNHAHVQQS